MTIYIPLKAGSPSDLRLRKLMEDGGAFPLEYGPVNCHAVVRARAEKVGSNVARYTLESVDLCGCGKPMHPLPFKCDACDTFAFAFSVPQ
jgi:hypothetical protein